MGIQALWQSLGQYRWDISPSIARHAVGEDHLACSLDCGQAGSLQMQSEMPFSRLDPREPCAVADRNIEKMPVPAEIFGPVEARNALHRSVSLGAVPCFVPGLKAEGRNAEFGPRQILRRPQYMHASRSQPDAGLRLVLRRVDHRHLADPSAAQREGKGATALP